MVKNVPEKIFNLSVGFISTTTGYPLVIECLDCYRKAVDQDMHSCQECGSTNINHYRVETYID